jgi:hypothetical protein
MLSLLLLLVALVSVWFGVALLVAAQANDEAWPMLLYAMLILAYGMLLAILLLLAWCKPCPLLSRLGGYAGMVLVGGFGLGSLDYGRISAQEFASLLLCAAMAYLPYFVLRALVNRPAVR